MVSIDKTVDFETSHLHGIVDQLSNTLRRLELPITTMYAGIPCSDLPQPKGFEQMVYALQAPILRAQPASRMQP
jgi:hypothetical protein